MKTTKLLMIGLSGLVLTVSASAREKGKERGDRGPKKTFTELDADKDGKVSEAEFVAGAKDADRAKKMFERKDKDEDGFLSEEEFSAKSKGRGKGKGKGKKKEKEEA